jgi:hypothetical protein
MRKNVVRTVFAALSIALAIGGCGGGGRDDRHRLPAGSTGQGRESSQRRGDSRQQGYTAGKNAQSRDTSVSRGQFKLIRSTMDTLVSTNLPH